MRTPTALVTQREFNKGHGDRLAANLALEKLGLPTMNHRDGGYWIVDGQHRIYALRKRDFGDYEIECRVYENLTDQQMADTFIGLNAQLNVSPFSLFHLHCTAEHPRETAIRRIVETNGCKISRSKEPNCISAVTALAKVKALGDDRVLGQVVRTLRDAYDGDPTAFTGVVIEGLGQVFNRFNGMTDEKHMVQRLSAVSHGVPGILRKAAETHLKTGSPKTMCIAAVIVDMYNRALADKKKKLPSWWQAMAEREQSTDKGK